MAKIVVFLNGKARQIKQETGLRDLVTDLKLNERMVLVEHNGQALLRSEWNQAQLSHGDRLEFIKVVAGG